MEAKELMDLATESAKVQLEMNRQMVTDHLDASDRIHARRASEAISAAALSIVSDPTN